MWPAAPQPGQGSQCQSLSRRGRTMLRLSLLLILLTHRIRTAYVTEPPSFAERLDKLYEKLERFTVAPAEAKLGEKLRAKLDRLNSLTPGQSLTDDDEELLSAIQMWGVSDEQMRTVIHEMQSIKDEEKNERLIDGEYADADWNDEDDSDPEIDYANDVGEEWDPIEEEPSSTSRPLLVTPSAITRLDRPRPEPVESAVEAIAATNERPRILDDLQSTPEGRLALRRAALANMAAVVRAGQCVTPQPRWLPVRKMAPAAGTVYMPPCVQLHRCAADAGCCYSEGDVCAPVDGTYVAIPFFLNNANGNLTVARMVFYNHTRCACVPRDSLRSARGREQSDDRPAGVRLATDWRTESGRSPTDWRTESGRSPSDWRTESARPSNDWRTPTEEPRLGDEVHTAPPQMRRCTCPRLFRNHVSEGACSCICDWADAARRRDCLSLSRGREHFGLKDRVCIDQDGCTPPTCEHGSYDRKAGRCPSRRYKRRYARRFHPDKTVVV